MIFYIKLDPFQGLNMLWPLACANKTTYRRTFFTNQHFPAGDPQMGGMKYLE